MKVKVKRYDPETGRGGYDTFEIEPEPGMTVLDALFAIQNTRDDSLAFRYACRGAICGSCAMLINRVPRLACRTQVARLLDGSDTVELKPYPAIEGGTGSAGGIEAGGDMAGDAAPEWNPAEEILIEPLPHHKVVKDLVVDIEKFFCLYRAVEPALKAAGEVPKREFRMEVDAVKQLEEYTNCILCGACVGACPVNSKTGEYLGPAALAKLYRFHIDPREAGGDSRLLLANCAEGWWGCEFHTNCMRVCPKKVKPNVGIGSARRRLTEMGKGPPGPSREPPLDGKEPAETGKEPPETGSQTPESRKGG
jgi:succinate dehydrogenase / fumarate reductase iron-sulfur subunit